MPVTIPTNYSWSHIDRFGSRGPALVEILTQLVTDLNASNTRSADLQGKLDDVITAYNAHLGSAGVHIDQDTENTITSPAATDVTVDILALLNDEVTQYEAHRVLIAGSVHGAADATNVITATSPATTEAEAIALANDLKAMYEAHRVLTAGSVHGAADNTNTIASADATDWDSVVTLINEFKNTTGYEDHRVLTAGSVHGAEDNTNVVTAADAGAQITALYTELNEFKANYNVHTASEGYHPLAGTAEATANATTEATAVALVNALKATLNTHFAAADVHLDADTLTIAAADSTEYEDILTLTAEVRTDFGAHIVKSSIHTKADAANTETTLGVGGAVTIGLEMGSVGT
jgi:hypothetical protein